MKYADIMTAKDLKRYNSYIEEDLDPNTPCTHIWVGWRNEQQRGRFMLQGKRCVASRIAYSLAHPDEDLPDDINVLHHCDRPQCLSEACLWLGSQRDNMMDCAKKLRHNFGAKSITSKLDDIGVMLCRHAHVNGLMRIGEMARKCGVSHATMSLAVSGKQWAHLPMVKKSIEREEVHDG